jgi:hypothetical protein
MHDISHLTPLGAAVHGLPAAVQRYLRFIGVVGRPREGSFRTRFAG